MSFSNDTLIAHYNFWDDPVPHPDFGTLFLVRQGATTGIDNNEDDIYDVKFFPIPAADHINIVSDEQIEEVFIYNSNSQLVKTSTIESNNETIDISALNNGQYYMIIMPEGNRVIKKTFVIVR